MAFGPYPATVVKLIDGDTMRLDIDLGFDVRYGSNCRVYGINAPELRTPQGKEALAFAATLVKAGDQVKVFSCGWDKYGGRFDGDVVLSEDRSFATLMLDAGHAVVYKGGARS